MMFGASYFCFMCIVPLNMHDKPHLYVREAAVLGCKHHGTHRTLLCH